MQLIEVDTSKGRPFIDADSRTALMKTCPPRNNFLTDYETFNRPALALVKFVLLGEHG